MLPEYLYFLTDIVVIQILDVVFKFQQPNWPLEENLFPGWVYSFTLPVHLNLDDVDPLGNMFA